MNVKEYRESLGLSQREFSARFAVNERTLQRIEAGLSRPSPMLLKVIQLSKKVGELEAEIEEIHWTGGTSYVRLDKANRRIAELEQELMQSRGE